MVVSYSELCLPEPYLLDLTQHGEGGATSSSFISIKMQMSQAWF